MSAINISLNAWLEMMVLPSTERASLNTYDFHGKGLGETPFFIGNINATLIELQNCVENRSE